MLTETEILKFISEDAVSAKKRKAEIGQKYYDAEHDITRYRVFYYNYDGKLIEDTTRANIKISHPFFTELVDQTTQYMLSGEGGLFHSDLRDLTEKLELYFTEDFKSVLADVITGSQIKGFEYLYAYRNNNGTLSFQCADGSGVIEVKAKETEYGKDYVIYWYNDLNRRDNKMVKRIQIWDDEQTIFYVQENGKLLLDEEQELNPRPHVIYKKPNDTALYYDGLGFIPFFRLDNNKKQQSSLKPIKPIIDDYDMMSCGMSNNLVDFDHPLHIVKGFAGDNLDELEQNIKTKKMIGVGDSGGIDIKTVDVPYQARLTKMQEDEKNIYRFGMGFNSAQVGDGNITNIVIKSRYALLDMKCNKLEFKVRQFLNEILKIVIDDINRINGTAYKISDVKIKFKREIMTNASDNAEIELKTAQTNQTKIETILNAASLIGQEQALKKICDILSLDYDEVMESVDLDGNTDLHKASEILKGISQNE
ncbi:MAG: phage portal protein [Candidatus Fimenecus sp.]